MQMCSQSAPDDAERVRCREVVRTPRMDFLDASGGVRNYQVIDHDREIVKERSRLVKDFSAGA